MQLLSNNEINTIYSYVTTVKKSNLYSRKYVNSNSWHLNALKINSHNIPTSPIIESHLSDPSCEFKYEINSHNIILTSPIIEGHLSGPSCEFKYEIDASGNVFAHSFIKINNFQALSYLSQYLKNEILTKIKNELAPPKKPRSRYKVGRYYLKRKRKKSNKIIPYTCETNAISQNLVSKDFIKTLISWDLKIYIK